MKNLAELQHTFQDCVLNSGNALSTAWVSASGRASPEIQLSIYTHAYSARLTEVLVNDYILYSSPSQNFVPIIPAYLMVFTISGTIG